MDCAYNNSKPGVQIKVQASDISGYHMGQYSCILCGEPVKFYRGEIQKSHFRHERGSIIAQTCEFYTTNMSEFSEEELRKKITGLPFYLKQIDTSFKLYIGFWPVDDLTLTEEKRIGQKITIKNDRKLQIEAIDLEKIHANKTYRLPISLVYNSYKLKYKISGTPISEIWGEKTSRIFSNGLFFRIGSIYSRSINLNGIITTDTSYYLLSQSSVTNKSYFKVEESYSLLNKGKEKWKIYKIRFTKITRESSKYARDLHVQLLEKPPEIIPLWPPSIQKDRKYIHQETGISTYCLSSSNKYGKWEVAILNKHKKQSYRFEIFLQDPIFSIDVDNHIKYLSFFDTDNDFEVAMVARDKKKNIQCRQPSLELKWMKKEIIPGSELKAIKNADLSIKSDMKCDITRMRNHIPYEIFRNELSVLSFPDLSNGDTIIIRHGLDILATLYFRRTKKITHDIYSNNLKDNLKDEALYQKLLQQRGTFTAAPIQFKYIAARLENYPKTREYLKKALKTGRISKQAVDHFLKNTDKENSI
ncbi:hypothetical protein [Methanosarcina mazei]|uniref:Competence protein n=1 Tax=Methanosarcina mazei TaxID=2209 RepID=A0A0F8K5E9_METMZ|nr:hypothetical protein [Methanosarcina mazei]KKG83063.1 hypothetical protein DU55_08165 [Methanosarcina mazei]